MDIEQLYRDYNVPYVTEGHKHARSGWVNTSCPFCTGNPGYHLGYDTNGKKFVCWRCGGHYSDKVISKLLNVGRKDAQQILRKYGVLVRKVVQNNCKVKIKGFKLPNNTEELKSNHIKYLRNRNFNPTILKELYEILGTGVFAKLDDLNYKHRIIIPYYWDGRIVSFDSRDITNKSKTKYLACPLDRELVQHKKILYGLQRRWGDTGICVEGTTDVWRMGSNSFATSGIKYTSAQVRSMAKQFKRVFIIFDNEPQAVLQANKLVGDLKFRGVEAHRIDIKGDPAGLTQIDADYLVKQLIK